MLMEGSLGLAGWREPDSSVENSTAPPWLFEWAWPSEYISEYQRFIKVWLQFVSTIHNQRLLSKRRQFA